MKTNWPIAFLILLFVYVSQASAHTLPISDLMLVADEDYLHLELSLNPTELNFLSELENQTNRDAVITRKVLDQFNVRVGTNDIPAETAGMVGDESHHLILRAHFPLPHVARTVQIESRLGEVTSASHFTQVTFRRDETLQLARLDQQTRTATFRMIGKAGPLPPINRSSRREEAHSKFGEKSQSLPKNERLKKESEIARQRLGLRQSSAALAGVTTSESARELAQSKTSRNASASSLASVRPYLKDEIPLTLAATAQGVGREEIAPASVSPSASFLPLLLLAAFPMTLLFSAFIFLRRPRSSEVIPGFFTKGSAKI